MEAIKVTSSHKPPSDGGMAKEESIRVGTTLYKIVEQPRLNGGYVKKRIPWNNETLRQDYGKDYIGSVPKYDGFCTVPEHIGYRPVIGKFLNLYEPIYHQPQEGDFPSIRSLVEHIFGEQYELGMDYLQLLYLQPVQKLPILLLVSEERNTGKSTFLNFLKALFQNNVTFNTNEDFRSQFNSDWAGKLLIVVDEVLLNRREDSERLKNLSTTLYYKVEAKGKDRDEIAFFAKFVLCSNNEYLPVIIDAGETRYWVRKINRLQSDDTNFLQRLKAEIPAFLHFLINRKLSTERESRMWFNPSLLHTEALQRIIRSNRYFKGCLAPKDITHIRQQGEQRDVCYLFEGFMDYLSFLTIRVNNNPEEPHTNEHDYMVLNSVTNLSKAEQLLRPYSRIGCFLDNDQAGQRAYENLKKMFGNKLQDMSHHYAGHKDLNDYLCHRNQAKQAEKKSQVQSASRMPQPQPKKKRGFRL